VIVAKIGKLQPKWYSVMGSLYPSIIAEKMRKKSADVARIGTVAEYAFFAKFSYFEANVLNNL